MVGIVELPKSYRDRKRDAQTERNARNIALGLCANGRPRADSTKPYQLAGELGDRQYMRESMEDFVRYTRGQPPLRVPPPSEYDLRCAERAKVCKAQQR
jgi:hypothetical protein